MFWIYSESSLLAFFSCASRSSLICGASPSSYLSPSVKSFLKSKISDVHVCHASEISKHFSKQAGSKLRFSSLNERNCLNIGFYSVTCFMQHMVSSMISRAMPFGESFNRRFSCIMSRTPSHWMKYIAFSGCPFNRLDMVKMQFSLSHLLSIGEVIWDYRRCSR